VSVGGVRPPAVAGSWYPDDPQVLRQTVEAYLDDAQVPVAEGVRGLIAPHAGLIYSGPVAGHAYRGIVGGGYDVVVLLGPSHYVGFEGVAVHPDGRFDTPLGSVAVDDALASELLARPVVVTHPTAHDREHALEMQLPFLQAALPGTPVLPLVMGTQDRETILALADALGQVLAGRRALLVASTDLSHFFDAGRAAELDAVVAGHVDRFDADGLLAEYERYPVADRGRYVACGGGAAIAVMRAAARLGADDARVLCRSDSAAVSGDTHSVVGYLAAMFGQFADDRAGDA